MGHLRGPFNMGSDNSALKYVEKLFLNHTPFYSRKTGVEFGRMYGNPGRGLSPADENGNRIV